MLQKDRTRDVDVIVWLESLVADVRYAAPGPAPQPRSSPLVAVLSLALGIGANTAIFSLANAMLLRSLPVRDPGALMQVTFGGDDGDDLHQPPVGGDPGSADGASPAPSPTAEERST